ncbi:unnamed protein product [Oppiella nova]|uniref:Uncharacterized protein n=1 Tax=Oppiella nova TaxID=334625 RepID=A0A7R9L9M5_9ACAR|nr:unnamed protein product [Oppiella nova]CAG2161068.1 unnamed protein product [Oppiella nova]
MHTHCDNILKIMPSAVDQAINSGGGQAVVVEDRLLWWCVWCVGMCGDGIKCTNRTMKAVVIEKIAVVVVCVVCGDGIKCTNRTMKAVVIEKIWTARPPAYSLLYKKSIEHNVISNWKSSANTVVCEYWEYWETTDNRLTHTLSSVERKTPLFYSKASIGITKQLNAAYH